MGTTVGHPVDVASGVVTTTGRDIDIPGWMPLTWERLYSSERAASPESPQGWGWTTRYFATLTRVDDEYHVYCPEGYVEAFRDPEGVIERGGVVRNFGTFQELTRRNDTYVVTRWDADAGSIERLVFPRAAVGIAAPLTRIEDESGRRLELQYDSQGRLNLVRQHLEGRSLRLTHTAEGRIATVIFVSRTGHEVPMASYEYDAFGRLITAVDVLGYAERYEYDSQGRLTREIARDGGVFSFQYDALGRCTRTSGLDGYDAKKLRYMDAVRFTEVTDSYGNTTRYQFRDDGQVFSVLDPLGGETKTEFDDFGRVVKSIKPSGATTTFLYDEFGNRHKLIDEAGGVFEFTYNANHQVTQLLDANGHRWRREYDNLHRLTGTADPNGAWWMIEYDATSCPTKVTNPLGAVRTQRYEHGVLVETSDWKGQLTRLESDEFGNVIRRTDASGMSIRFTYDLGGRPTQVHFPDGSQLAVTYDSGSNVTRLVNGRGAVTEFRYGPCARLLERRDPNGHTVKNVWGTEPGRLLASINEKGEVTSYEYDAAGRKIKEITADGQEYTFELNPDGWCIQTNNPDDSHVKIVRDPKGRVIEHQCSDGRTAKYAYDGTGNLVQAANQSGKIVIQRDPVGRVIKEIQDDFWVESKYNAAGFRTRINTSQGFSIDIDLDANGDMARITTANDRNIEFHYDASRRELLRFLPGELQLEQRFDSCGRLAEQRFGARRRVAVANASQPTASGDYQFLRRFLRDPTGAPTRIDDSRTGATHYAYDLAGFLIQATSPGLHEWFTYDETGNIVTMGADGAMSFERSLVYGPGDKLQGQDGTTYQYDRQGRLIARTERVDGEQQKWAFVWDDLGQLVKAVTPDDSTWEYTYDALGRRTKKIGPEETTTFIWDGDTIIHELRSKAAVCTSWVFSDKNFTPLAQIEGDAFYSIISDHLGTPREAVDTVGRIAWLRESRAYGEDLRPNPSTVECPFRFQGQYQDAETGLCYNRFRYYDPDCGRYIQPDPLHSALPTNDYHYAPSPTNWIDPYGLAKCHDSGDRGRAKAKQDLESEGFKIVDEEVTMMVNGHKIRADFVVTRNGRWYVFEVKNGTGRLTENQTNAGVFNMGNPANQNGTISTAGGSGTQGSFTVATGNRPNTGARDTTRNATFGVLHYDGTPGSRVSD